MKILAVEKGRVYHEHSYSIEIDTSVSVRDQTCPISAQTPRQAVRDLDTLMTFVALAIVPASVWRSATTDHQWRAISSYSLATTIFRDSTGIIFLTLEGLIFSPFTGPCKDYSLRRSTLGWSSWPLDYSISLGLLNRTVASEAWLVPPPADPAPATCPSHPHYGDSCDGDDEGYDEDHNLLK